MCLLSRPRQKRGATWEGLLLLLLVLLSSLLLVLLLHEHLTILVPPEAIVVGEEAHHGVAHLAVYDVLQSHLPRMDSSVSQ